MNPTNEPAQLRVRHRSPLHAGWSYPLGVEALTASLGRLPHAAPAPLWFSHGEEIWLSRRRERELDDLPMVVLEAEYTTFGVGPPDPDRPVWTLRVHSVPSSRRRWVNACLLTKGLPLLRQWLGHPFADTALHAQPRARVLFREGRRELMWEHRESRFEDAHSEVLACEDQAW